MDYADQIVHAMFEENPEGDQECELNDDGSVQIVRILSGYEGTGVGTRAMNAAIKLADQLGVDLRLSPDGTYYEDKKEAEARLRLWYAKFGFELDGPHYMRRKFVTPALAISGP